MAFSSTFKCVVCGIGIDPKSTSVIRQATVWLKGTSKTVVEVVAENHLYRHVVCTSPNDYKQLEIF
jgi:hypothetical protein